MKTFINNLPFFLALWLFGGFMAYFTFLGGQPAERYQIADFGSKRSTGANQGLTEASDEALMPDICGLQAVYCFGEDIEQVIRVKAREYNLNENKMLALANCESKFDPLAVGDNGHSKGLWQINDLYHDVSDEVAFDPILSTDWAFQKIKNGQINLWSCAKKI